MLRKIRKMLKHQEGFTLVELMIVVVILGILAGVGIQQYGRVQERVREEVNDANLKLIASAVQMYQMDNNENPTEVSSLVNYGLAKVPASPWGGGRHIYDFTRW
jgi:prepilin-type N-terminal cleavage/methylation domain-containing protein